jgi:hypothetical protein
MNVINWCSILKLGIYINWISLSIYFNKIIWTQELSDRRFTILETGGNLANIKWFDTQASFKKFKKELPQFAQYLWNIKVDMKKANTPFEDRSRK